MPDTASAKYILFLKFLPEDAFRNSNKLHKQQPSIFLTSPSWFWTQQNLSYCWLLSLPQHKTTIRWGPSGFFTISGLPNVPETEHTVITAPEHEEQQNHKCCPRISMCLTYFQQWSRGIQPYMPHWKKGKMLALDALRHLQRSKRGAPGNLHAWFNMSQVTCCGEQQL